MGLENLLHCYDVGGAAFTGWIEWLNPALLFGDKSPLSTTVCNMTPLWNDEIYLKAVQYDVQYATEILQQYWQQHQIYKRGGGSACSMQIFGRSSGLYFLSLSLFAV